MIESFSFYYWFTSSAWSTIEKLVLRFEPRYSTHCVLEQLCSCLPSTNLARLGMKVTKEDRYLTFKYCTYRILLWFVVFLFLQKQLCVRLSSLSCYIYSNSYCWKCWSSCCGRRQPNVWWLITSVTTSSRKQSRTCGTCATWSRERRKKKRRWDLTGFEMVVRNK